MQGRCTCGRIAYRLTAPPMIVHCCHCSWCQRESGSAFAVNAVVEAAHLEVTGDPELIVTPSASGKGQEIARCPDCQVALWSHYPGAGRRAAFVRVGTMDDPGACPPDVHIYTSTMQDWFALPEGARGFAGFYNPKEVWPEATRARWSAMLAD